MRSLEREPPDSILARAPLLESWFERTLTFLFPTLLLDGTPWRDAWDEKERRQNVVLWRLVFPAVGLVYIAHLVFFDIPMELQPPDLWVQFRLSIAALCFAVTLFYLSPGLYQNRLYRIPTVLLCWVLCYTQAKTALWYEESQYLYAFVFVAVSTSVLRASLLTSLIFATATLASQWTPLIQAGISPLVLYSAGIATFIFVYVSRSTYLDDIRFHLANQRNLEAQKQIIEMNIEFTDRIRAFLPHEISQRLTRRLSENSVSVLDAVDDVLRPEEREVACLFSDIRGYTKGSKQSLAYLEGVIPNVKKCTAVIERSAGVPRKIGDLIFAYFDDPNAYVNLVHCVSAGFSLVEANQRLNQQSSPEASIQRYVLISSGRAIVGNIGGYDSSIEITALGSPVNLLSRIDELTKTDRFRSMITESDLILCESTAKRLHRLKLGCQTRAIRLADHGLKIRDYEEVEYVYLLPATKQNCTIIWAADKHISQKYLHGEPTRN